jgi:hypothetical protein
MICILIHLKITRSATRIVFDVTIGEALLQHAMVLLVKQV